MVGVPFWHLGFISNSPRSAYLLSAQGPASNRDWLSPKQMARGVGQYGRLLQYEVASYS